MASFGKTVGKIVRSSFTPKTIMENAPGVIVQKKGGKFIVKTPGPGKSVKDVSAGARTFDTGEEAWKYALEASRANRQNLGKYGKAKLAEFD